jgi:oligopeptide/dipeptide ABC transporter ATP-binding protein
MSDSSQPVLAVRGLVTTLRTAQGQMRVVDDVSFEIPTAGKVALVGESGSGKTMTALSIMRLVPKPAASITSGSMVFKGQDLLSLSEKQMRSLRGNELSMVFQEPMTALNPVLSIGYQVTETLHAHRKLTRKKAWSMAVEALDRVGIASPETRIKSYPHQLSGGMRQRVMMAIAMCCEPSLLIADEPTTALDVTIEAQILSLLDQLRSEKGTATLLITHDLGVVAGFAEQMVVMYAGQVVEVGAVLDVFGAAAHPYTHALLQSLPPSPNSDRDGPRRLAVIDGRVPDLFSLPVGCRFQDRCPKVFVKCRKVEPSWTELGRGRGARCHLLESEGSG